MSANRPVFACQNGHIKRAVTICLDVQRTASRSQHGLRTIKEELNGVVRAKIAAMRPQALAPANNCLRRSSYYGECRLWRAGRLRKAHGCRSAGNIAVDDVGRQPA